jgi:hypothetical protein
MYRSEEMEEMEEMEESRRARLTAPGCRETVDLMTDVGEPKRVVEDEPISWPEATPLVVPEPTWPSVPAAPERKREPEPVPG